MFLDQTAHRIVNKDRGFAGRGDVFLDTFSVAIVEVFAADSCWVAAALNRFDLDLFVLGVIHERSAVSVGGRSLSNYFFTTTVLWESLTSTGILE